MSETAEMIHKGALPGQESARVLKPDWLLHLCAHDDAAKTAIVPGRVSTPVGAPA